MPFKKKTSYQPRSPPSSFPLSSSFPISIESMIMGLSQNNSRHSPHMNPSQSGHSVPPLHSSYRRAHSSKINGPPTFSSAQKKSSNVAGIVVGTLFGIFFAFILFVIIPVAIVVAIVVLILRRKNQAINQKGTELRSQSGSGTSSGYTSQNISQYSTKSSSSTSSGNAKIAIDSRSFVIPYEDIKILKK